MNEVVVIDEIAKQLGIAADQVSGHVAELWPVYVEASKWYTMVMGFGGLLLFLVCLVVFLSAFKKADEDDYETSIPIVLMVVFGVLGLTTMVVALCHIPQAITYLANPDGAAMLNLMNVMKG